MPRSTNTKTGRRATPALPLARQYELTLRSSGVKLIAGVDEAGLGPMAGPVVAGAVILRPDAHLPQVNDSKKLKAADREAMCAPIREGSVAWALGVATRDEIDAINIYHAGLLAMRRALRGLAVEAEHALVDGKTISDLEIPQTRIVGGDACELCIAAASVLAKVHRDQLMDGYEIQFPGYGFAQHKGYPTPAHKSALAELGATPLHRMSFPAVQEICGTFGALYMELLRALDAVIDSETLEAWRRRVRREGKGLSDSEKYRLRTMASRVLR